MKKQNKKSLLILAVILCMILAAGAACMLMRAFGLEKKDRQLDEQFERELEESQKTIDKLKEQEAEMETDVSSTFDDPLSPTTETLFVSLADCRPGEILSAETLYMDNPGIYFTARQILEGDEIYQRIQEWLLQEKSDVAFKSLRYLKMPYYDQEGKILVGEMIVNAEISQKVLDAFQESFQMKQKISALNLEENLWAEPEAWTDIKSRYHLAYEKPEEEAEADDAVFVQE